MSEKCSLLLRIKIASDDLELLGFSEDFQGLEEQAYLGQLLCSTTHGRPVEPVMGESASGCAERLRPGRVGE